MNCLNVTNESSEKRSTSIFTHWNLSVNYYEVQLLSPHIRKLPEDCQLSTVWATIETLEYLNNNQWLYALQKATTLTIMYHVRFTNIYSLEAQDCASKNSIIHQRPVQLIMIAVLNYQNSTIIFNIRLMVLYELPTSRREFIIAS